MQLAERRGFEAAGADLSAGMIERARENAREAGTPVDFRVAGFGELAEEFSDFDVLLCLGNSLPHVSGQEALGRAVEDFAGCLRIGGLLMVQNRNFDAVMQRGERWMGPEAARAGDREWLFMRFYDFDPDGRITFHVATLTRQGDAPWEQKVDSTRLYPLRQAELEGALRQAGFDRLVSYGDMGGDPFDSRSSGNLVVSAIYQGK
jgi:glycine/sarcosine N-methyltransferase